MSSNNEEMTTKVNDANWTMKASQMRLKRVTG